MPEKNQHRPDRQIAKRLDKPLLSNHIPRTRCSDDDRSIIEANAEKAGLKLGEYVRQMCVSGAVNVRASVLDAAAVSRLTKLGLELNAIGRNLNQLVTKAHVKNKVIEARLIRDMDDINNMVVKIDDVVMRVVSNDP